MRVRTRFLFRGAFTLTAASALASGQRDTLRVSLTVVERCDIHGGPAGASVDCSAGVPWAVASAPATGGPATVSRVAVRLPVPERGLLDGGHVTTIVF